jgi:hypothetical protein
MKGTTDYTDFTDFLFVLSAKSAKSAVPSFKNGDFDVTLGSE